MRWLLALTTALWISLWLFYAMSHLIQAPKPLVPAKRVALIQAPSFNESTKKTVAATAEKLPPPPPPPAFSPPPPVSLTQPQFSLSLPHLSLPEMRQPQLNSRPFISAPPMAAPAPRTVANKSAPSAPQLDQELVPVLKIPPRYPRRAARAGKEGWVKLELSINEKGSVSSVKIIDSQPKRLFDRAAKRAVLKWKFRPKMVNGRPVPRKAIQLIEFKLKK